MTVHLNDLCCLVVEEFYGEFYARLFSYLTYHGRLSAQQLAQKVHLPLKQVRAGLASLIQCRLVFHHTTAEGSSTYRARISPAYDLLRTGRLIEVVNHQIGHVAARVISEACLLGFTTIGELEAKSVQSLSQKQPASTTESYEEEQNSSHIVDKIHIAIEHLLNTGYLRNVRSAHFQSDFDARQDVEIHFKTRGQLHAPKGKKAQEEADEIIQTELNRRLTTRTNEYGNMPESVNNDNQTSHSAIGQSSSKRQKLNGGTFATVNGHARNSLAINLALLVSVNYGNVVSDIRNDYLSARAKKCIGTVSSRVLSAALSQVPASISHLEITDEYLLDLERLRNSADNSEAQHTPKTLGHNGVQGNGTHEESDDIEKELIDYHEIDKSLALLTDGEFRFLKGTRNEWTIDKSKLDSLVRQKETLRLMGDKLQPPSLRILRMLMDKGKLDEKTLQELGLLERKKLQQTLAQLKQKGFIDLQEVPKEAQRQPNRTIYLWFYDAERVQRLLLDNLYKTMSRILQRMKFERGKLLSTLEKVERHGVDALGTAERGAWNRWLITEKWLLGELSRLDESVALLRDL